jgi:hypothetical protein
MLSCDAFGIEEHGVFNGKKRRIKVVFRNEEQQRLIDVNF